MVETGNVYIYIFQVRSAYSCLLCEVYFIRRRRFICMLLNWKRNLIRLFLYFKTYVHTPSTCSSGHLLHKLCCYIFLLKTDKGPVSWFKLMVHKTFCLSMVTLVNCLKSFPQNENVIIRRYLLDRVNTQFSIRCLFPDQAQDKSSVYDTHAILRWDKQILWTYLILLFLGGLDGNVMHCTN